MNTPRSFVPIVAWSLVAGLALTGCGNGSGGDDTSSSPSPTRPPTTTASVYYLVDTGVRAGLRLAREPHDLVGASRVETAISAVEAMIAGPDDPDYVTTWNPDTQVMDIIRKGGGVLDVDLSADARQANVGSPGAALMIQQLVYTVTEIMGPKKAVQLTIQGKPAGELWGVVSWDSPVRRADPMDVRLLVQIDEPREGATTASPLKVTGDAAAFEANVPWRVLDDKGKVVRQGNTMTSEGMTFAPYSFSVRLRPGTYTVEVDEDDPSGGEAPGRPMRDTRTVRIER